MNSRMRVSFCFCGTNLLPMALLPLLLLLAITSPSVLVGAQTTSCPPEGLTPLQTLDFGSFISAPWFIVKVQAPLFFLQPEDLFCLRAAYTLLDQRPRACFGPRCRNYLFIDVFNSGNEGAVDGPSNTNPDLLDQIASIREPDGVGEIFVGFPFLPERSWGALFVYAAGTFDELLNLELSELAGEPSSTDYDWAILSGDLPSVPSNGACLSGLSNEENGEGLFLYSRDPTPSQEIIDRIEAVCGFLGFDVSVLRDVAQEGCVYPPFGPGP